MFTGIIEEVGTVKEIKKGINSSRLMIEGKNILSDVKIGDSIAVNGVCLTVTSFDKTIFNADVMSETLSRSSLGSLSSGSQVNLERAMAANGRFGGHIVSGHIDGTGIISNMKRDDIAVWITINTTKDILNLIVEKGSIAIDGISLTVTNVNDTSFTVSIIPHTGTNTTLLTKKKGEIVNLENDIIGKYVQKLMGIKEKETKGNKSNITMDFLAEYGF
ncbi:MAG: riboflavin synthase [Clostridia bacterium]|jgi:riboflavin synthase|nr:riboflavin synthase [Clostridia bacterium]MCI2000093.1 riboflavin synthase [Clostridia bacterium]MCI2014373.1 riboflavin synthase [Clostridia bacterium]